MRRNNIDKERTDMKRLLVYFASIVMFLVASISLSSAQNVLELDAIVVEGRIMKPEASYILQRASLEFGITAKRKSFVKEILKTVDENPF